MPPKVKYKKEEIVSVAVDLVREKGIGALTAREIAASLGGSTQPIFTCFSSMEDLKTAVYLRAKEIYKEYLVSGLDEPIPFLGVGKQYIRFAKEERELYRMLFLVKPEGACGGAIEAKEISDELVRDSVMRIYNMDAETAEKYYRDLWLVSYAYATLIVTDECPYTEEEIFSVFSEISLAVCKAYKEVPGLVKGEYDKDAIFKELVKK